MRTTTSKANSDLPSVGLVRAKLGGDLETLLQVARPRLIRMARACGVARDNADDAVQETFFIAWRRLDYLHSPERFDAWLDGICHHVSQHYIRRDQVSVRRLARFAPAPGEAGSEDDTASDVPDLDDFDPSAELHRQDLEVLLDRALGYISESSRTLIELCYLYDLPQREVAEKMGLTLGALEMRLLRTRRELRRILSTTLRSDAQALDIALDDELPTGWRESREWCNFCGRHRLQGMFDVAQDGRINFRLRCPECSPYFGGDIYSTGGVVPLVGVRSFRPALKRLIGFLKRHYAQDYTQALLNGWQGCPSCGQSVPVSLVAPGSTQDAFPFQWRLVFTCAACGRIASPAAFATCWAHDQVTPLALQFIETHPHWVIEPDVLVSYAGQPAIRFRLADVVGGAQLTILSDAKTLQVRALAQT